VTTDWLGLYKSLVRERLGEATCTSCGMSLGHAVMVSTSDGTSHQEHGLCDKSIARLFAATELLEVRCDHCGAPQEVGMRLVRAAQPPSLSGEDVRPWSADAVAAYRKTIQARLAEQRCSRCQAPLVSGRVVEARGGGTVPEQRFDETVVARLIGLMQDLTVECPACGERVKV